ncbi:M48 family metallopeptidase [Roseovarius sp. EL26]|uniref:tetratricopeptide repeat protein n=1 Tax=Roseovarius sp. EL26 TaxID=2126672 RepID=UPI000EA33957|nr:hypothetical protein [Roseovarius sp. EL26]
MLRPLLAAAIIAPSLALAGGGSSTAPKPSETTQTCTGGKVWDKKSKSCVDPQHSALTDDQLYQAVREFAYHDQLDHAQTALSAMSDQDEDRVLTYWGFTYRKLGEVDRGMVYYRAALTENPANILARSYMGQAMVEQGDLQGARHQLLKIREYNGKGSWAEASLYEAITTGQTYSY